MDSAYLSLTQVSERHWHALSDDRVVGRGEVSRRPDGRLFLSIDAWEAPVFDSLAELMLASLPRPLYTVVDEADDDLLSSWERAGLAPRRREWEYVVPTDPRITGLGSVAPPPGVTVVADRPRVLDPIVGDEVEPAVGHWDPISHVALRSGQYVGLVRVAPRPRQPRIGLVAVRDDLRRRGVAQALLAEVLGAAHRRGVETASADVNQSNSAATALFEGIGAVRAGSNLELVVR